MATSQIAVRRQLGRIPGYPATEGGNLLGMLFPGVEPTGANLRAPIVPRSPLNPDGD